jgi:NAD-dependent DNA ligase
VVVTLQLQVFLSRIDIAKVKTRALRRGICYSALTRMERACIDLVIRLVDKVHSRLLAKVLFSVMEKLEEAMEGKVSRLMREVGSSLAKKLSEIASEWGNVSAVMWVEDSGFIRYLAITCMNMPPQNMEVT